MGGICVIVKEIFNIGDFIMPIPFLSVLIFTKNNQRSINYALMSVQPYADEIIVLDSGSQDKTLEIANRYTNKIYFREFEGHFGQQKNYGLSKCTGKWILVLDSDEFIGENFPYHTMPMQELPEPDIMQALHRDESLIEYELRENYFITLREHCKWKVRQAATSLRVALKF